MKSNPRLYLALPTYDGARHNAYAIANALLNPGPFDATEIIRRDEGSSLLAHNFNTMWADALNLRADGVTHFLLLHADVLPHATTWLADLYAIMERKRAQALSVILPIKDAQGLTSTALSVEPQPPKRLTLRDLSVMPPTFTVANLLVNTGLLLVDFREPWVEQVWFTIRDRIIRGNDGQYRAAVQSEDWFWSERARALGVTLWATREISASHRGPLDFPNISDVWSRAAAGP